MRGLAKKDQSGPTLACCTYIYWLKFYFYIQYIKYIQTSSANLFNQHQANIMLLWNGTGTSDNF